ncbi:ANTAR domain-containing response regulator [Aureimonas phyllosphaerae]|uniref:Response regulator NasT n=1 Tax=Aureimonas phyllosphaerae TaxID=1166078 RepID=A0A7W6FUU1_9HYPH|nr:ANTAR domain-containing response regulator [Aureimonas phyllosphaerae]MBB3936468.1 response regulator NasT [Aureimonas phyllosphaerae]MBB3960668.1 response regulator NasT [Aureimonas phyllosphaerae]SFF29822.1 response regulator receiver and ANTAR domain protein [Aureimonas phyllosphaerae]
MEPRPALAVLIVDENRARAAIIEEGLREAGHERVHIVADAQGLVREIEAFRPDVIVVDLENPNRDRLEAFFQVSRSVRRPIAMFVDRSDADSMEAAIAAGVSAYVVDGLKKERVKPILDTAVLRFEAYSRLERELQNARSELADRKVVERAKGLLMRMRGLSEEEAYRLMRQTAMNEKKKLVDIARSLVTAASLLGGED